MNLEEIRSELARRSLLEFTKQTFPAYRANWHHELICERLDALVERRIRRLMVFVGPRHGKSELGSRRLPAYILGRNPDESVIATSYGAELAQRMNRDVQRIIETRQYQRIFPQTTLTGQTTRAPGQGRYMRNSDIFEIVGYRGSYRSAGVGGGITGMGATFTIIDDPIKNKQEAESPTYRNAVWDWYTSTLYTRLEQDACILLMVTRWHEDDLAGRLLAEQERDPTADQWEVVRLPAIKDEDNRFDSREYGEPLWPKKYSLEDLQRIRTVIGSRDWEAMYQQRPAPMEGGMFQREWFSVVRDVPAAAKRNAVRYWDMASTEASKGKTPDYTVGALIGEAEGIYYVIDLVRGQWSPMHAERAVSNTAESDGQRVPIYMEQEPGSSGKHTIDHFSRKALRGYSFRGDRKTGSKIQAAELFSAAAEAGNVRLLHGPWNKAFLDEVVTFPFGKNDDQVDAVSGGMNKVARPRARVVAKPMGY